jgi:hypothetical protein
VTGSVCKDEFADDPASGSGRAPRAADNALHRRFDEAQLVELAAAIAWENYRGRFNRVFGVRPVGFCKGGFCALIGRQRRAPKSWFSSVLFHHGQRNVARVLGVVEDPLASHLGIS